MKRVYYGHIESNFFSYKGLRYLRNKDSFVPKSFKFILTEKEEKPDFKIDELCCRRRMLEILWEEAHKWDVNYSGTYLVLFRGKWKTGEIPISLGGNLSLPTQLIEFDSLMGPCIIFNRSKNMKSFSVSYPSGINPKDLDLCISDFSMDQIKWLVDFIKFSVKEFDPKKMITQYNFMTALIPGFSEELDRVFGSDFWSSRLALQAFNLI